MKCELFDIIITIQIGIYQIRKISHFKNAFKKYKCNNVDLIFHRFYVNISSCQFYVIRVYCLFIISGILYFSSLFACLSFHQVILIIGWLQKIICDFILSKFSIFLPIIRIYSCLSGKIAKQIYRIWSFLKWKIAHCHHYQEQGLINFTKPSYLYRAFGIL